VAHGGLNDREQQGRRRAEPITARAVRPANLLEFLFRKERVITCAPFGPQSDVVRAIRWDGSFGSVKQRGTLHVCRTGLATYRGGDSFTTSHEAATIFNGGAHVFGAGLDVQSGFSRFVSLQHRFGGGSRRHFLCGPRGQPVTEAPRIFSGKART
jgi:hypothetical protein